MPPRPRRVTARENDTQEARLEIAREVLKHPVRQRLLAELRMGKPKTQRELGRAYALSTAKVHYHLKLLSGAGLARLSDTRSGPNGITEKLYTSSPDVWKQISKRSSANDRDHMLDTTLGWIQESLREGAALVKQDWQVARFLAGSSEIHATEPELKAFAKKLDELIHGFCKRHRSPRRGTRSCVVAFSILPAQATVAGKSSRGTFDWKLVT